MELSDEELGVLSEILWEETDRDLHEPSRRSGEDREVTSDLWRKVRDIAEQRGLWWAR